MAIVAAVFVEGSLVPLNQNHLESGHYILRLTTKQAMAYQEQTFKTSKNISKPTKNSCETCSCPLKHVSRKQNENHPIDLFCFQASIGCSLEHVRFDPHPSRTMTLNKHGGFKTETTTWFQNKNHHLDLLKHPSQKIIPKKGPNAVK